MRSFVPIFFLVFIASVSASPVAQWTGEGDGVHWSDPENWMPEAVPGEGSDLVFGPVEGSPTLINDIGDPWVSGSITFTSEAPAYRLRGAPVRLTDTLRNQSGEPQVIDLGIIISMSFPEDGLEGNRPPTIDTGSAEVILNGPLPSHSGHRDHNPHRLTKVGSGVLVLRNNDNTFRGRHVLIFEGILRIEGSRVAPLVVRNIQMREGTTLEFGMEEEP